jgi:hypothetical protein
LLASFNDGCKHVFQIVANLNCRDAQCVNAFRASPLVAPFVSRWVSPAIMREAIDLNG